MTKPHIHVYFFVGVAWTASQILRILLMQHVLLLTFPNNTIIIGIGRTYMCKLPIKGKRRKLACHARIYNLLNHLYFKFKNKALDMIGHRVRFFYRLSEQFENSLAIQCPFSYFNFVRIRWIPLKSFLLSLLNT